MILISWILCFPELTGEMIQGVLEAQVHKGLTTFLSFVTKRLTVAAWIKISSPLYTVCVSGSVCLFGKQVIAEH